MPSQEGKMKTLDGISASPGVTIGHIFVYDKKKWLKGKSELKIKKLTTRESIQLFKKAIDNAIANLESLKHKTEEEIGVDEGAIFDAQILILEDEDYQSAVIDLTKKGKRIDDAIIEVTNFYVKKFEEMENEYFKERAADIRDVGNQLINALLGNKTSELSNLKNKVILVSQELTPSDTAEMSKDMVLGFVTEAGGVTSHVAIIARSLNLPAIVGVKNLLKNIHNNQVVIIDGINGRLIVNPDKETIAKYRKIQNSLEDDDTELKKYRNIIAKTRDGYTIEIQANVGSVAETIVALENGADGIGLLRTEFLYLGRKKLPTEEELFDTFREILTKMKGRSVILRTLDVGGDKDIPCIKLPVEANPFLGIRGSRIVKDPSLKKIIVTQLRAALRASKYGNLKIMFPMISTLKEVLDLNILVQSCRYSLENEGYEVSDSIEVGIMIEIPSVALCSDIIAPYVDFFSIGTNDLTQYTLASDRTNEGVANLYDHYHPSVFRLIKTVVASAEKYDKWVGVCGEIANETLATPILIGLGVKELSMSAASIPRVKRKISKLTRRECEQLTDTVLNLTDPIEVRKYLAQEIMEMDTD